MYINYIINKRGVLHLDDSLRLSFEDAGISFAGRTILHGMSFTLGGGSVVAVRGANGSGKSTLLRLAAGLLRPTEGSVALRTAGSELQGGAWQESIACLSPELSLYPLLTAAENLDFFLGLRGVVLSEEERRTLLTRVGLVGAELWQTQVAAFSTGMRQRLKIAVLLGADAPLWLLDEPGANLDEEGRALIASLAREAASEGRLVLWATNEQKEEASADAKLYIARGEAHLS